MLEQSSACLQRGALRRLATASTCSRSSRRTLHSTFWTHGAGQLDYALSALSEVVGLEETAPNSSYNAQAGTFLDFLYPSKTLALIRSYSASLERVPDGAKSRWSRKTKRPYSSLATDPILSASAGIQNVLPRIERREINAPSHLLLQEVETDEAWTIYTQLSNPKTQDMQAILSRLGKSVRLLDIERALQVYNDIPPLSRTIEDYRNAAITHLKTDDIASVLPILREAQSRFDAHSLIDNVTAKAVAMRRWDVAFECWIIGQSLTPNSTLTTTSSSTRKFEPRKILYWSHVERSEGLCESARLLYKAPPMALSTHWTSVPDLFRSRWQAFQQSIACSALTFGSDMTDSKSVLTLFDHLKRINLDWSSLYNRWIEIYLASGEELTAMHFYKTSKALASHFSVERPPTKISHHLVQSLVRIGSREENVPALQALYTDMVDFYSGPDLEASRLMLKVFARHRRLGLVQKLVDHIFNKYGPPTDCFVLTSLMHVHAQRGDLARTREVFDSISSSYGLQPNVVCHNILLRAYARKNDFKSAQKIFDQLRQQQSAESTKDRNPESIPDVYTYGTMMGIYARKGEVARVDELYRMALDQGVHISTPMINCLVYARVRDGDLVGATRIVDEATKEDSHQSLSTMWNYIILGHVYGLDLQGMKDTYGRMQEAGVPFDSLTYAALIKGLVFQKRYNHAIRILWKVMPLAGMKPRAFHHGILMSALVEARRNPFALFIYEKMISRGIRPNQNTKVQMLRASANLEKELVDLDYVQAGEIPDDSIARNLEERRRNAFKKGTLKRNSESRHPNGTSKTEIAYLDQLIQLYAGEGDVDRVDELQRKRSLILNRPAVDGQHRLPFQTLSNLALTNVKAGRFEKAEALWQQLVARVKQEAANLGRDVDKPGWVLPTRRSRLCIPLTYQMQSLAGREMLGELVELVREFRQDGFVLSNTNVNIYVECLSRSRSPHLIQLAFEVCERDLMGIWTGWKSLVAIALMTFGKEKLIDRDFRPYYSTIAALSNALLDLKQLARDGHDRTKSLDLVSERCQRTIQAIQSMPRVEDESQMGSFLREAQES